MPAPRDDGKDPRTLDEESPYFKAGKEICRVMDAIKDDPTKLEPSECAVLGFVKHELLDDGALSSKWAFLEQITAQGDYDVDVVNADQAAQNFVEASVRLALYGGESRPSVTDMLTMGPLLGRTVMRLHSFVTPSLNHRTQLQSRPMQDELRRSQSDEARATFLAFVEGRKYDGVHVCTTLARGEKSWPAYWEWCLEFLAKESKHYDAGTLARSHARFFRLLKSVRSESPAWACAPEMRKWFEARQCRYQRMMV